MFEWEGGLVGMCVDTSQHGQPAIDPKRKGGQENVDRGEL
jgi:hypothetical protein